MGCAGAAALSAAWALNQFYNKYEDAVEAHQDFYRAYVADRITGFTTHWMTFSEQMMLVLLVIGAVVFFSTDRRWIAWLIAVAALISVALIAAETRSVWFATAVGGAYLLWFWKRWALIALPVVAGIILLVNPFEIGDRVMSVFRPNGELDSNAHRRMCRLIGYQMIKAHPLIGIGPEASGAAVSELPAARNPAAATGRLLSSSAQHLYSLRRGTGHSGDARHRVDAAASGVRFCARVEAGAAGFAVAMGAALWRRGDHRDSGRRILREEHRRQPRAGAVPGSDRLRLRCRFDPRGGKTMQGLMMNTPLTLTPLLERAARLFPEKEIVTKNRCRNASLHLRRFSRARASPGVGPATAWAFNRAIASGSLCWNSYRHLELYFAVTCYGAVLHTLNLRLATDQLAYIINHADDRVIFVDASLVPLLDQIRGELPGVREVVVMDDGERLRRNAGRFARRSFPVARSRRDRRCATCYTSGTTGHPKGVLYTHRSLVLHSYGLAMADSLRSE